MVLAIVSYDEEKKLMFRRKDNIVVKDVTSLFTEIPHRGKDIVGLSKEIQLRDEKIRSLEGLISSLNHRLEAVTRSIRNDALIQQHEHAQYKLKQYDLHCYLIGEDIDLLRCIGIRNKKECTKICSVAKQLMAI